jgi:hypothetical protein
MAEIVSRAPADPESNPRENCYGCFKPVHLCLCNRIEKVANRTPITIVQHPRERFHAIGTARIARLGLEQVRVEVPRNGAEQNLTLPDLSRPGMGLLFPRMGSIDLAELTPDALPRELVILDGTWPHARRLYDANPWLHALPHHHLIPDAPSRYRIRKPPRPGYISTIEAIVAALRIVEPDTEGFDRLIGLFDAMIDEQVVYARRAPRHMDRRCAQRRAPQAARD